MAVQDLWLNRHGERSSRWGRGMRWRVVVAGWPSKACRTKAEAETLNAQRIAAGPPGRAGTATVGECVDRWLDGKRGLSTKGLEACQLAASYVREQWRDVSVEDVDPVEVQAWVAALSTPKGPASASLKHKAIQCLAGAVADRVDLSLVRVPKEHRREAVFLDVEQLRTLARLAGQTRKPGDSEAMVWLLGTTGLRVGEACALNVGDVDATRRRLRVHRTKTGVGRDVPIPASVLELLDLDRPAADPLLRTSTGGRVGKDNWRARHWAPARDGLGVAGLRIHDLRHTAASLAIASGADVKAVQRMLGHESAAMTLDLYGHLWDRALDDVAARMERLLGG